MKASVKFKSGYIYISTNSPHWLLVWKYNLIAILKEFAI